MIGIFRFVALTGETTISAAEKSSLFLGHVYRFSALCVTTVARSYLVVKNPRLAIGQMYSLGVESLPLVSVIAVFLGWETVIQAVYQMAGLIPMRYLGVLVCKTLTIELCPVVVSIVFAGRVATGIAAEIGSMKATEQLDAMRVLRLDPIRYLIVPKTIACIVMVPVAVIWAELLAFTGSIIQVLLSADLSLHTYFTGLRLFFNSGVIFIGIGKTAVFGAIIALTGSYFGFEATNGAEGVGNATTKAVITAAVLILAFDFIIALLVL